MSVLSNAICTAPTACPRFELLDRTASEPRADFSRSQSRKALGLSTAMRFPMSGGGTVCNHLSMQIRRVISHSQTILGETIPKWVLLKLKVV